VQKGYVEVSSAELRQGWQSFRDAYSLTDAASPGWLSKLHEQEVPEIAAEAMSAQRHFFIAMHPPHLVWNSVSAPTLPRIASPAVAISNKQGKGLATAGVILTDNTGRTGVTTALHALTKNDRQVFVTGAPVIIRAEDVITDSCFLEIAASPIPSCGACNGPLSGVTPGRGEDVWFDGVTSGRITTHVDGWTYELPWVPEGVQARIITPPVTEPGDSGAALMTQSGKVAGFAMYRTGFNYKSPHSAWVWAESVFSALQLH
jgi:hypothetical protein